MNKVFGDAFYFFALLNKKDSYHARAVQWSRSFTGVLVDHGVGAARVG